MKTPEDNFRVMIKLGYWSFKNNDLDLNLWVDKVYKHKEKHPNSVSKSNQGGYQSEANIQINPEFFPLVDYLNNIYNKISPSPIIKMIGMWINISSFGHFNSIHRHQGTHSGVIYLKTPPNSGNIAFHNPINVDSFTIHPQEEGEVLFFPSFLHHSVEPNLSQEDRISIAFNYE